MYDHPSGDILEAYFLASDGLAARHTSFVLLLLTPVRKFCCGWRGLHGRPARYYVSHSAERAKL